MKELPPKAETLRILIWKIDTIKYELQASEYHLCKSKYSWHEVIVFCCLVSEILSLGDG